MITVEGLVKTYGGPQGVNAVDDVSFEVAEGQFYTLLGPSGCGKTTTLRCVAGLERADRGRILLDDIEVFSETTFVPANRREIGMVFQSYAVWPHMTVFDNVAFPLRHGRHKMRNKAKIQEKVDRVLALMGLEHAASRGATQLSGGQQQRLALARAVVEEPRVLLLDEPLSNLDAKLRERMRSEIRLLQQELSITTLFVTHDQAEALSMSDRIAVMNAGQIIQEGSPRETYFDAGTHFVASFIASTNVVPGKVLPALGSDGCRIVETSFGELHCAITPAQLDSGEVTVAIRPEAIQPFPRGQAPDGPNVFQAEVKVELFEGTYTDYFLKMAGDQELRLRQSSMHGPDLKGHIDVALPSSACRILAPDHATGTEPVTAA
jgi:iron(III) transport system ATP-binding protein